MVFFFYLGRARASLYTRSSTDVVCFLRALTITDEGTVAKKEEQVRVVIKHPLQNWGIDLIDKPSSKSQCPELSVAPAAPVAGQVTVTPSSEGERHDFCDTWWLWRLCLAFRIVGLCSLEDPLLVNGGSFSCQWR